MRKVYRVKKNRLEEHESPRSRLLADSGCIQVVPSLVLPYREPLSDHDTWPRWFCWVLMSALQLSLKVVATIGHWLPIFVAIEWAKSMIHYGIWGLPQKCQLHDCTWLCISTRLANLRESAALFTKDRDIGRFHCTTDFFAEVEYWIRESRLIALICDILHCNPQELKHQNKNKTLIINNGLIMFNMDIAW